VAKVQTSKAQQSANHALAIDLSFDRDFLQNGFETGTDTDGTENGVIAHALNGKLERGNRGLEMLAVDAYVNSPE
jgi:hypothetical protein